jgi:hypothetical protein
VRTRPGLESLVRAELARQHARPGSLTGGYLGRQRQERPDSSRAVASVVKRGLADTGREASAAASMPLAAAPSSTRASTNRAVVARMRGG